MPSQRRYTSGPLADGEKCNEHFLSFETPDQKIICAFLRLRLPPKSATSRQAPTGLETEPHAGDAGREGWDKQSIAAAAEAAAAQVFPELIGCALVRELHVYGQLVAAVIPGSADAAAGGAATAGAVSGSASQHSGFGRQLMARAEEIAAAAGFDKLAVISGVGARAYYRKLGYTLASGDGQYMIKPIERAVIRHVSSSSEHDSSIVGGGGPAKTSAPRSWQQNWDDWVDELDLEWLWAGVVAVLAVCCFVGFQFALLHKTEFLGPENGEQHNDL